MSLEILITCYSIKDFSWQANIGSMYQSNATGELDCEAEIGERREREVYMCL